MAVLTEGTIRRLVADGTVGVEPFPTDTQFQPASLDFRIEQTVRNPSTDEPLDTLTVVPKQFCHAYSKERFEIPNDLAVQMTGRSSLGRAGIVIHLTAGWFDPGFRGHAKMEIYNFSRHPFEFEPNMRVGQMVFLELDQSTEGYSGQFQDQTPDDIHRQWVCPDCGATNDQTHLSCHECGTEKP